MKTTDRRANAFSLVEVALALGIAAFCLVPLMGLIPLGLTTNRNSLQNTLAASAAAEVASDLRTAPVNSGGSASKSYHFGIPVPGSGGAQTGNLPAIIYLDESLANCVTDGKSVPSQARFQVSVGFAPPVAGGRTATQARILVTWPPQSNDPATMKNWPTHYTDFYETTVALDCN